VIRTILAAVTGALLASASPSAAQPADPVKPVVDVPSPAELTNRTIRAESLDGTIVNTIYLDPDGTLRIIAEQDGDTKRGRWFVRGDMVCLEWRPRGRECWPYEGVPRGQPTVITSDRGQRVRVTAL
jgi:hypothetical protein